MSNKEWLNCTKCNTPVKPVYPEHGYVEQIDDGVKLIFSVGYGMFTDNITYGNPTAFLCHDCVVLLLEFFPESFKEKFKNGHPHGHKPDGRCCEYSWSFKDE